MEVLKLLTVITLLTANMFIMRKLAERITRNPLLTVRPFNCAQCATFWLTVAGGLGIGAALCWPWMASTIAALGAGLFNYYLTISKIKIEP